jgi:hypothetical protein
MKSKMLLQVKRLSVKFLMLLSGLFLSLIAFAQDKQVDINVNTKSDNSNFFTQPWVWIVGGAIFILLLVALLRGNKSNA